jgi:hypothetical protein
LSAMRPGYSKVDPDRFSEVGCASAFRNRAPTAHPGTLGRLSGVATHHFSGSATGAVTPVDGAICSAPPPAPETPWQCRFQQPVAVLGERGRVPHRLIQIQPHKPAVQNAVVDLLSSLGTNFLRFGRSVGLGAPALGCALQKGCRARARSKSSSESSTIYAQ